MTNEPEKQEEKGAPRSSAYVNEQKQQDISEEQSKGYVGVVPDDKDYTLKGVSK